MEKENKPSGDALNSRLIELWGDSKFSGSASGIKDFQTALRLEKGWKVNQAVIRKAFQGNPVYLQHIRRSDRFPRRRFHFLGGYFG